MNSVVDAPQRKQAIDPTRSFCVSAPAGSGKTELLIQRYLALLARVQRPEQVLAITFTRKAAAEMRERVMQALRLAAEGVEPESPHQALTRKLAAAALAADARGQWQLLSDVSRLNIKTIDSFCLSLTRQMPILSLFGGQAVPVDDAAPLYEEAVGELFAMLDSQHAVAADLRALLAHFDNNWERLRELLMNMLARRNQWAMYIGVHEAPQESEQYLVATVQSLVRDELAALARLIGPYESELLELLRYAADNLGQPAPMRFPRAEPADVAGWRALRGMLMTNTGTWRAAPNKNQGFPAASTGDAAKERLQQVKKVLAELSEIEGLAEALAGVELLPELAPGESSWQMAVHLSRLLPVLAAQLLLVFRRQGAVDHTQVSQSALTALGEDDNPTDLALRLDYRIEHMLVDEFQDTSINQFDLIGKLTRGWVEHNQANPDNPRTLMIVGDAMQSIYGFRDANVGLFLKARDEGFNGLRLQALELQCNFRSDSTVIDWVNGTFSGAFPAVDDVASAQVKYSPATAVRPAGQGPAVSVNAFVGDAARDAEVEFICDDIARHVQAGEMDIAVLGRQRSHLQAISARLKLLGVPFQAQELDSLAQSPLVADLVNLCRALANEADRVAWLGLLRAPWCGLGLADMLQVANFGEQAPQLPIARVLGAAGLHERLSEEGGARVQHVQRALEIARAKRDRLGLRAWIELVWLNLGGAAAAASEIALEDAESFLRLLEKADTEGRGLDIAWLEQRVQRQFMSGGDADCPVQLMTLHKAKGLEFERVYIPRLNGTTRGNDRDILLWDEHSDAQGQRAFLLAADDRSPSGTPTLYNFLRERRKLKDRQEATRLIYVGATRAVKYLHLSAGVNWDEKKDQPKAPPAGSLLATIWPAFREAMVVQAAEIAFEAQERDSSLRRLDLDSLRRDYFALEDLPQDNLPERAENHYERSVGTVVHLALEELAQCPELPASAQASDLQRWRHALQALGLNGDLLAQAIAAVQQAVDRTLTDEQAGRWILDSEHPQARNEWALTCNLGDTLRNIIIDRSFVDKHSGVRWIVDYKSSRPGEGEDESHFLQREAESYREQLRGYSDALAHMGAEPIRCALYFTALGRLHELPELAREGGATS